MFSLAIDFCDEFGLEGLTEPEKPLNEMSTRGGSRGMVQGVSTPPWDDLRLSNTTGVLQKMWFILKY